MSAVKRLRQFNHLFIVLKVFCISLNFQVIYSQREISTSAPLYESFPNRASSTRKPSPSSITDFTIYNVDNEDDLNFPNFPGRSSTRRPSESGFPDSTTRRNGVTDGRGTTRRSWITQPSSTPATHLEEDPPNRRSQNAPRLNLTAQDSNNDIINMIWYRYRQNGSNVEESSLNVRGLRKLTLTFTCNDTYPIKWLSRRSFGTPNWYIEESRHFDGPWRNSLNIQYTIILRLTYEKEASIPQKQELVCARLVEFSTYGDQAKQSSMEVLKRANSTLTLKSITDSRKAEGEEANGGKAQYAEPLGANVECLQELKWAKQSKRFECTSDGNSNLTIAYVYDNCYDSVSCERRFTPRTCRKSWRHAKTEFKAPTDMWTERDTPPSGVVSCKWQNETSDSKSAALLFYHSLPPFCPEDHPSGRRQLYIAADHSVPSDDALRRDFVSFCATEDRVKNKEVASYPTSEDNPTKYAGENMSVSCITSLYHFAKGSRIGQRHTNGSYLFNAVITDSATTLNLNEGYINYTAKVLITDPMVTGILCETYLKQSANSIMKLLRIVVKTPKNITFLGGVTTQLEFYNYSGQYELPLRCDADGDPRPTITWRRQNKPIPTATRTMLFTNGSVLESLLIFPSAKQHRKLNVSELYGTYICEAANRLSRIERTFHVGLTTSNSSTFTIVNTGTTTVSNEEGGSLWYVWAIIVPLFLLVLLAVIGFLVWKIKLQSRKLSLLSKSEVDEFKYGKPEFLQSHSSTEEVNNYAAYLPYNQGYEVGKEQLELDPNAILGSGAYAIVLKGTLHHKNGLGIPVAIKTAKPMDDISFFKALLSELKIMGFIGTHKNIVNLMGAYTRNIQNREIFIAIEYCGKGCLLMYLRDNRHRFTNLLNDKGEFPHNVAITKDSVVYPDREGMTTVTFLKWAQEIASGMEFLGQKKVVHGDLAARNILLTDHLVAKIGDFGLSRQLTEYANYIKKQMSPLPWKWLAIECLQDMRFSVKSDVWAYSILLYEIFTLGQVPFPGHSYDDEFLDALVSGKRPNKPGYTTKDIYNLMLNCWNEDSHERPSFTYIYEFFGQMLSELVPPEYLILHERITSVRVSLPWNPTTSGSNTLTNQSQSGTKKEFSFNINPKTVTASVKIK